MNYMMMSELGQVAELLKALNQITKSADAFSRISLGSIAVYDSNGETVGYIAMCDSAEYALYPGEKNPEDE